MEGPLKANIASALLEATTLAVPGVTAIGQLAATLGELHKRGMRVVVVALDEDRKSARRGGQAQARLRRFMVRRWRFTPDARRNEAARPNNAGP